MQTILYTDTNQIRSMLGLSEKDMSDAQITSRAIEKELSIDLASWVPTHLSVMTTAGDLADSLQLYCTYFCAVLTVSGVKLAAPQAISDGKNSVSRFNLIDFDRLKVELQERQAFYKRFVINGVAALAATSATPATRSPLFSVANLASDPVTNT